MANNDFWGNLPTDGTEAPAPAPAPAVTATAPAEETAEAPAKGGKRKKSAKTVVAEKLEMEVNASGNATKFHKYSGCLEVIKSLGFSDEGSYINSTGDYLNSAISRGILTVVPASDTVTQCYVELKDGEIIGGVVRAKEDGKSVFPPKIKDSDVEFTKRTNVPLMVGYIIKNIGNEAIPVYTTHCFRDGQGVWQESAPELTSLAPGAEMQITKKMLVFTSALLEYSGEFANGTIVSRPKESTKEQIIEQAHFVFKREFAGRSVHDADFKIRIDQPDEAGFYRVLPEYEEHFGVLENMNKNKNKQGRKTVTGKYSASDILAKLIRDSLNQQ